MRNYLKRIISFLVISIFTFALIGCGDEKKKESTPEQSLKAYLDIVLKGNGEEGTHMGLTKNQVDEVLKFRDKEFQGALDSEEYKEAIDDSLKADFLNGIEKAFEKIEYNIIKSNISDDTAVVELEIKGIDVAKLQEDTISQIFADSDKLMSMTEKEAEKEILKAFIKNFENASIVSTPTKVTVDMIKSNDLWIIEEEELEIIFNSILVE